MKHLFFYKKKGFTLAELLIVVAIIGVLVAIAIPIFTTQLEKSRESVDFANVRSAYSTMMVAALSDDSTATYNGSTIRQGADNFRVVVSPLKQQQDGWTTDIQGIVIGGVPSSQWKGVPQKSGSCTITYSADTGTIITWSNGYNGMSLVQLRQVDNEERIAKDQQTLQDLGQAILAQHWTTDELYQKLGILKTGGSIRIADYDQLKTGDYSSDTSYSSAGFRITSNVSGELSALLQGIGYADGGELSHSTSGNKSTNTYNNALFYSDQLASNKLRNYSVDQTKRSVILENIKTDADGKISSFTIYTKAMDGQANLTPEEKQQFSFKIGN